MADEERFSGRVDNLGGECVETVGRLDIVGLPHVHFLESITLLATEVKPRVDRFLTNL